MHTLCTTPSQSCLLPFYTIPIFPLFNSKDFSFTCIYIYICILYMYISDPYCICIYIVSDLHILYDNVYIHMYTCSISLCLAHTLNSVMASTIAGHVCCAVYISDRCLSIAPISPRIKLQRKYTQDTSINRTLSFVPNTIFMYLTSPEMRTAYYSGHYNMAL